MTQVATMEEIAIDVKALIEALSEREVRFNAKLMTRTAKLLRLISGGDLEQIGVCGLGKKEE